MEQGTDVFLSLADQDSEDILHVPVAAMSNVGETICAARPHYDNVSAALRFTGFEHARTHGSEFRSYGEALMNPLDREGATRTHAQSDGQPSTHARSDGEPSNSRLFSFPVGRVSSSAVPIPDSEGADSAGAYSLSLAPKDTLTCCRAPALFVKEAMQQSADALYQLPYVDPLQYIDPIIHHLNTHQEGHPGIFRQAKTKGGSVVYLCRSKVIFVSYFQKFCAIQCNPCALRLTVLSCPLCLYSTRIMQEHLHHN
jgi:hypothetical protein